MRRRWSPSSAAPSSASRSARRTAAGRLVPTRPARGLRAALHADRAYYQRLNANAGVPARDERPLAARRAAQALTANDAEREDRQPPLRHGGAGDGLREFAAGAAARASTSRPTRSPPRPWPPVAAPPAPTWRWPQRGQGRHALRLNQPGQPAVAQRQLETPRGRSAPNAHQRRRLARTRSTQGRTRRAPSRSAAARRPRRRAAGSQGERTRRRSRTPPARPPGEPGRPAEANRGEPPKPGLPASGTAGATGQPSGTADSSGQPPQANRPCSTQGASLARTSSIRASRRRPTRPGAATLGG